MATFEDVLMLQKLASEIAKDPLKYTAPPYARYDWDFHLTYDHATAKKILDSHPDFSHNRPQGLDDLQLLYNKYGPADQANTSPHSITERPKSINIQGFEIKYAKPPGELESDSEFTETDEESEEDPDILRRQSMTLTPEPLHLELTQSKQSDTSSGIGRRSAQRGVDSDHSAQYLQQDVAAHASLQMRAEPARQPVQEQSMRESQTATKSQPFVRPSIKSRRRRDTQSEPAMSSGNEMSERMFQRDTETEPPDLSIFVESTTPSAIISQPTSLANDPKEPDAIATSRQSGHKNAFPVPAVLDVHDRAANQPSLLKTDSQAAAQAYVSSVTPSMVAEAVAVARQSGRKNAMPPLASVAVQRGDEQTLKQVMTSTANTNSVESARARIEPRASVQNVIKPTPMDAEYHTTDRPSTIQQKLSAAAPNSSQPVTVPVTAEIVAVASNSSSKSLAPMPASVGINRKGQHLLSQAVPSAAAGISFPSTGERATSETCVVRNQLNRKDIVLLPALENNDRDEYRHPLHQFRMIYEESANTTRTGYLCKKVDSLNLGYSNAESTQEDDAQTETGVGKDGICLGNSATDRQASYTCYGDRNNNISEVGERVRLSTVVPAVNDGDGEAPIGVDVCADNGMLFEYASTASPQSRRVSRSSYLPAYNSRRCSVNVGLQPDQRKDEIVANSDELRNAKRKSSVGLQGRRVSIADVSPQLGFKDAVRAPNGVFICETDSKKFELVVEEALDAEEGVRGVQCTPADIDADMDILFAPLLIEPAPEVVKKKIDVAVQWTGSECSPSRSCVRNTSGERGVGILSNAISVDKDSPTQGTEGRANEDAQKRIDTRVSSASKAADVLSVPVSQMKAKSIDVTLSEKETKEGDVSDRPQGVEANALIDVAGGDISAVDLGDVVPVHHGETVNVRGAYVADAAVEKAPAGFYDEVQHLSQRSIIKGTSVKTVNVKTASQSGGTNEANSRRVAETSGRHKSPTSTGQPQLAAHLCNKRSVIASNMCDGVVVEELPESVLEASAMKSSHNRTSRLMVTETLVGKVASTLCDNNDHSSNTLMGNEVTDSHEAQSEIVSLQEGDYISEPVGVDRDENDLEVQVRVDPDQETEKEGDVENIKNNKMDTGMIQTEESMPLENAEQDVENYEDEEFEPFVQGNENCEVVPSVNNSGTTDEAWGEIDNDFEHNAGCDVNPIGPIREFVGKARNEPQLDVARVINLDLFSTPPKRSTVLMPSGVDIKPQATPAGEQKKPVRKATKRRRETQARSSRKISPNTQKRERSRREMHRLGLASLPIPPEVTTMSEAPSDGTQPRRSKRRKFPPLQYWRNEKKVYERRRSQLLPTVSRVVVAVDQDSEDESQMSFEALKARKVVGSRR